MIVRRVDRRRRRTMIDERKPARVAMRENIHRAAAFLRAQAPDQFLTVLPDSPAIFRVFVGDLLRHLEGHALFFVHALHRADRFHLALDGPGQVHRRGARRFQFRRRRSEIVFERSARPCVQRRKIHSVSGGCADESRAAHMHLLDRGRHLLPGAYFFNDELMRKKALIDQADDPLIRLVRPDRPVMLALYFH